MSVSGILSSSLFSYNAQNVHARVQQFPQPGQDLQSGNLPAAPSDFVTLQPKHSSPIAQAFNQLSTDLQAGNTTAAQQDYATIQQEVQDQAAQIHHHRHHHGDSQENAISQLFQQLGQELQSGNLSAAQQAYGSLQTDLQQFAVQAPTSATASSGVSFRA